MIFSLSKIFILRGTQAVSIPPLSHVGPTIIATNHYHSLDPFAVVSSLPYRDFFRLAPFAFMTANYFYDRWWLRPFAWMAGCFPAKPSWFNGTPYGVDGAVALLRAGYTLVMFPEGKRSTNRENAAKPGVVLILQQIKKPRLVIGRITWHKQRVQSVYFADRNNWTNDPQDMLDAIYRLGDNSERRGKI